MFISVSLLLLTTTTVAVAASAMLRRMVKAQDDYRRGLLLKLKIRPINCIQSGRVYHKIMLYCTYTVYHSNALTIQMCFSDAY